MDNKQFKIWIDLFKTHITVIVTNDVKDVLETNKNFKNINVKHNPYQKNIDLTLFNENGNHYNYFLIINRENQKLSDIISNVVSLTHKILHNQNINIRKNNSEIYSYLVEVMLDKILKKSELENEIAFE